jgi:hypothetical protein
MDIDKIRQELREEKAERISYLRAARDALEQARYKDLITDHEDIYNAAIDDLQRSIDELIPAA